MTERLTTLQAVKDWLGVSTTLDDTRLTQVIDAASQFALNYMSRDSLQSNSFTQNFRGNGKQCMLLRNWPIISITQVAIGGKVIPEATMEGPGNPRNGWSMADTDDRAAPQSLELFDYWFWLRSSCQVIYQAGYQQTNNYTFVASTGYNTYAPQEGGQWTEDLGVTIGGNPATLTTSTDPLEGQYYVDAWGNYTFNDADAGSAVAITYSYAPWDVAFGVTQIVGEWWVRKQRIGVASKSLGGQETVSFTLQDINDTVKSMIQPYRNVVPV